MKRIYYLFSFIALAFLSACGSSQVTNVWEYYVTNDVVKHQADSTTLSKRKLLLSMRDNENMSQFELIAVKQDSAVYMVIGSQKMAKTFIINDSQYVMDVVDVYPGIKEETMAQVGDLTIYFDKVPASKCIEFLDKLPEIRKQYMDAPVSDDAITQIDFYFTDNVFISLEKKHVGEQPSTCSVWVGKRKHVVDTKQLVKALTALKSFN